MQPATQSGSGWTLLKSPNAWAAYRQDLARQLDLFGPVDWGPGPRCYPCLVTSRHTGGKILGCYVYTADARTLLAAAHPTEPLGPARPAPVAAAVLPGFDLAAFVRRVEDYMRDTQACMRSLTAHALTGATFAVKTGICKQDSYEEMYNAMLVEVDLNSRKAHDLAAFMEKLGG